MGRHDFSVCVGPGQAGIRHRNDPVLFGIHGKHQTVLNAVIGVRLRLAQVIQHHIADKGAVLLSQRHRRQLLSFAHNAGVHDKAAGGIEDKRQLHLRVVNLHAALVVSFLRGNAQPVMLIQRCGNDRLL